MSARSDLEVLGLDGDPTPAEVKARFHELAHTLHPDKGGDAAEFANARAAYYRALVYAARERRCSNCSGSGRVAVPSTGSFFQVTARCHECNGKGKISYG